ncbi:MAG: four helix bundle protein [Dehalococcoidia bacterium]
MSKVQRYEDLVAWQKARALTREIYSMTRGPEFARDFRLVDQIRAAAVSIMSNLAEGFERGSTAEFSRFVMIAKGSCAELRSQLYVALDAGHVSQQQFDDAQASANEVARLLGGLRLALERRKVAK